MKNLSLIDINHRAIKIIGKFRLLEEISWPSHMEKEFFSDPKKRKKLHFHYPKKDYSEKINALSALIPHLSDTDPMHIYTRSTIESYINAFRMIENVGNPVFQELSIQEYGRPKHLLFGSKYSHLKTAKQFLKAFHDYDHPYIEEKGELFSAKQLKEFLTRESVKILGEHSPRIEITKNIVAKAAAGKTKVRIRQNAKFSDVDKKNLLVHEVFTHTLTAINGGLQESLPLLGLGAPRTTKTQEGLATFSEVVTGLLDLDRLKRLSLRVIAIDMALSGADIYDLYDFFKSKGQSDRESFLSASRLLRGGTPKGGIVFTKDGVYLEGLIRVHSLFRWAFKSDNLDLIHLLFMGRMDINDIFLLRESFLEGRILPPKYLPDWYRNTNLLAGKMAFSLILNNISLKSVEDHYEGKFRG